MTEGEIGNACHANKVWESVGGGFGNTVDGPHEPVETFSVLGEATLSIITGAKMAGLHVCRHCGCLYWVGEGG